MARVTITLRPGDARRLAVFAREEWESRPPRDLAQRALRGERPSASSAVRALLDRERERRLLVAYKVWHTIHGKREVMNYELLAFDPVFGQDGATPKTKDEERFRAAYLAELRETDAAIGVRPAAVITSKKN